MSSYDGDIEKFIFAVTEVFKLAEHSDFYSVAPVFLKGTVLCRKNVFLHLCVFDITKKEEIWKV